jgi:cell wall-associated NlpC family hydrolase
MTRFLLAALTALLALALAAPAGANPPGPHDARGSVEHVSSISSGVRFSGWAFDPDSRLSNRGVAGYVDGHYVSTVVTSISRPAIASQYGTGPTPGFVLDVPVPADGGTHVACAVARNTGAGLDTVLKCVAVPLGRTVSSSRNPTGAITWASGYASAAGPRLHLKGWATDPDYVNRRLVVVAYVDGRSAYTGTTSALSSVTAGRGAGAVADFDVTLPASSGGHVVCIWVVNIGLGSNSSLGCRAPDTRGSAGTGQLTTPSVNPQIVAEAKRHLGQPYVWAAAGPSSFDCSGLVTYVYAKFGMSLPHQSAIQQNVARVIPRSRAVPGDLVFYHDSEGSL